MLEHAFLLFQALSSLNLPPDTLASAGKPQIPASFNATIEISIEDNATGSFSGPGIIEQDNQNKRQNFTMTVPPPYGNWSLHYNILTLQTSCFQLLNDRCQNLSSFYVNFFGWVPLAHFNGTVNLGPRWFNRTCDLWIYSNFSVCVEGNTPVLCTFNLSVPQEELEYIYFHDFTATTPPASHFIPPAKCFVPDPLCDGGAVTELDTFIFHPEHQFDLNNEDVADLLGDTVFICADANNTDGDHYQWVSRYTLQVWSGWGQYALCNRPKPNETGVCVGSEKFSVGREAAYGVKPQKCGQCTDNTDTGTWWSLPTGGMCNTSTQPLGANASLGQCSWRAMKRLKTIDASCLFKTQGMLNSCNVESGYPFTKSQAILLRAFEQDDPSQGGCPNIAP